jgi:hypothetical protein
VQGLNHPQMMEIKQVFEMGKAAVLSETEPGKLFGGVPVALGRYSFVDPEDPRATYHSCPCQARCPDNDCPLIGRVIQGGSYRYRPPPKGQLPPIAAGVPCVLWRQKYDPKLLTRPLICGLSVRSSVAGRRPPRTP